MLVTIIGPNLSNQSKGQFHVHAAGCSDITRDPRNYGYVSAEPHMSVEATTRLEVAGFVYEDHMAEAEPGSEWEKPEAYLPDFHFAPCVSALEECD